MNADRRPLSGSTDGRPIKIAATGSPGTTIHTAVAGSTTGGPGTTGDEIWLWVANSSGAAATLTVQWGGTTSPDDQIVTAYSIAANSGPIAIASGLYLRNGLVVKAYSGTANVLIMYGYVNRLTRTFYSGKVGGPS